MPCLWEPQEVMRLLLVPVLSCSSGTGRRIAEGQHWWLVPSALWIMVPRETYPNSTFWSYS